MDTPMARFLRTRDWASTALGPPERWPHTLRAALSLMLDATVPMWLAWGDELSMLYNDAYAELLGDKHPAAMATPLEQVWAEIWTDVGPLVELTLAGQSLYREDLPLLINRNGQPEQTWFTFSYSPLRDDRDHIRGLICTVWETTDRVVTQRNLARSEERLRALALTSAQAIYRMNPDWTKLLELHGQGFVVDAGRPVSGWETRYVHPDDRDRLAAEIARARASKDRFELEVQVIRVDGTPGWALSRAIPILDAQGEIIEWFGAATDVTAQHEAEQSLRESERLYRALFEIMDEGYCVIEFLDGPHGPLSDYIHVEANAAYAANAGIPNVVGQKVRSMVPEEAEGWIEIYRKVLVTGEPVRFQRELEHTGRYLELAAFRIEPPERRQVAVLFQDVTPRHRAELALKQLNETLERRVEEEVAERLKTAEALRQAQKMEAVGQLTGGIAHDFNNMLAVVIGSLDLLDRRFAQSDPRAKRYVDIAKDGARRAAQVTQRLLAFSRQQPLQPEDVDANKLVAGMSELLTHAIEGSIQIETVLAAGLWRIHADPNQLENAILNLAVNARDAMAEGGRLTIETANCHLDERYVAEQLGVQPGQYVMVAVTDTGEGMPPDVVAKAFDPFFTTKELGRGTGLGLSQVYGFIKQSGGHIKIYSEPGAGTTVKLYLPRLTQESAAASPAAAPAPLPTGDTREVVLVVEDDAGVRQYSVDALTELGYQVLEAEGGAAALALIDSRDDIDLLFTDVVMPGMNGRELADQARKRRPGLRVLFTTGYSRNAVVHNGVLDAGVQLIVKPFTVEELAQRVRTVLDTPLE